MTAEVATLANTPTPPYYAVIFTSLRNDSPDGEDDGYLAMAQRMQALAAQQPGFLGFEAAREAIGVTVSYWKDLESIRQWKAHAEHLQAQKQGRQQWYAEYRVRIAKVERDYARL